MTFSAAGAAFSLMAAFLVAGVGRSKKAVGWILGAGRLARLVLVFAGLAIAAVSAVLAIVVAFYSLSQGEAYRSVAWRITALQSVMLATGAVAGVCMPLRQPVIDVVSGGVRRLAFIAESATRVLVVGAWFTAAAILVAPASPVWVLTGVTLIVAATTWELGRRAADRGLVDAFAQAAAKTASDAFEGSSTLEPLLELERLSRHRYVAGGRLVSELIAIILRACVERLEPWERHDYRQEVSAHALQELLRDWDDDEVRLEIGRFATALRSVVVLGHPLARPQAPTSTRRAFWREFWFGVQDLAYEQVDRSADVVDPGVTGA